MKKIMAVTLVMFVLMTTLPDGCKKGNEEHFKKREEAKEKKKAE